MTTAALNATDSSAEPETKDLNNLANSETKALPAFPQGSLDEGTRIIIVLGEGSSGSSKVGSNREWRTVTQLLSRFEVSSHSRWAA